MTTAIRAEPAPTSLQPQAPVLLIASLSGQLLRLSEACRETLGYEPSELSGQDWKAWVHPADVEAALAWGAATHRGTDGSPLLLRMLHRSGRYRVFEWTTLTMPETNLVFAVGKLAEGALESAAADAPIARLDLDERGRRLFIDGSEIALTSIEFDLLALLLRNRGTVVSADAIARAV